MSGSWHGGKGDRVRSFDQQRWDEGYERIYGMAKKQFTDLCRAHYISDGGNPEKCLAEALLDICNLLADNDIKFADVESVTVGGPTLWPTFSPHRISLITFKMKREILPLPRKE